ncbi:MAG TPA: hypothetical protein VMZ91_11060 [Candidatus Paceibacterota bacterium]|nr:hypothetical protein [Candidatus Paceibacterota bacterium]
MSEEKVKYEYKGVGLNRTEAKHGKEKFDEYCSIYHISAFSDLQLLEELIYREIMQERFKIEIEAKKASTEKKNKGKSEENKKDIAIPTYTVDAMNKNLEQVLALKEKLGLLNKQDQNDGFTYIEQLRKKFKLWEAENQASRTFVCPNCSKMLMLHVKPDVWEVQEHKFFRDKILCNEHLVKLYKQNKITKEDVALILGTSPTYVLWLVEKWFNNDNKI